MRLDRVITLSFVRPWQNARRSLRSSQFRSRKSETALPILMYHSVSNDCDRNIAPYYRTVTHPDVFARQMAFLESEGYRGVTLSTGLAWLKSQQSLLDLNLRDSGMKLPQLGTNPASPPKTVVITFDDGYHDFYTSAFPVLEQHGFNATVFLPTAFIAETRREFNSRECLTWSQVRELHKADVEFGSHTVNHPRLLALTYPKIREELTASKAEIEHKLQASATTFAYPYAFPQADQQFVRKFRQLLVAAGYECCVTTKVGTVRPGDDPLRCRRLPANDDDDEVLLKAKLEGAYDWVAGPQMCVKRIAKWLRTHLRSETEISLGSPKSNP